VSDDALDLTPDHHERLMRFSAAHFRSGCPAVADRAHMLNASQLQRVREEGGQAACVQCGMVVRVAEKRRLDVALNLVDNARRWAGLERLTELERHFLRTVLSAREPLLEAQKETGMIFHLQQGEPSPEDPEPLTPAEKIAELVDEGARARECERRLPAGPGEVECDGDVGAA
jgi:hypothetical protein